MVICEMSNVFKAVIFPTTGVAMFKSIHVAVLLIS